MDANFATLNQKIDLLAAQVGYLTGQLETQQKRQLEFEELKRDMIPMDLRIISDEIDTPDGISIDTRRSSTRLGIESPSAGGIRDAHTPLQIAAAPTICRWNI